jgi:hypothetical protein
MPRIGCRPAEVFDDHAERYAASITLHEMVSAVRPAWGDGITDPRTTSDETPVIAAEQFEPALRNGLTHRVNERQNSYRDLPFDLRLILGEEGCTGEQLLPQDLVLVRSGDRDRDVDPPRPTSITPTSAPVAAPSDAHETTSGLRHRHVRRLLQPGPPKRLDTLALEPRLRAMR